MTNEAEDAVERLTEAMNDAIADHEDDVARAWEAGERPDLWDAPDVTVSIPDLRTALAALRAQAERVRVLEGELKTAGMYTEAHERLDDLARERIAAAEARAEAAERRAGEAEARVIAEMEYANSSRNIAARLHGALAEIARGDVPPEKEGHYHAHREAVRIARAALLPATQAENPQEHDDE